MHILNKCYNRRITTAIDACNMVLSNEDFQHCVSQLELPSKDITTEEFVTLYSEVDFPFIVKAAKTKFFYTKKTDWVMPGRPNVLNYNVKATIDYSETKHFKTILLRSLKMMSMVFKNKFNIEKDDFDKKFVLVALTFAKELGLLKTQENAAIIK